MFSTLTEILANISAIILYGLGPIMIGLFIWNERKQKVQTLRIDLNAICKFSGFLFMVMMLRSASLHGDLTINSKQPMFRLLFVFLEDAAYVLPIMWAEKNLSNRKCFWITVVLSLIFGTGHLYESYSWALMMCLYPTLSKYWAEKYGMITVMMAHVLYDISTTMTLKIMKLINVSGV